MSFLLVLVAADAAVDIHLPDIIRTLKMRQMQGRIKKGGTVWLLGSTSKFKASCRVLAFAPLSTVSPNAITLRVTSGMTLLE